MGSRSPVALVTGSSRGIGRGIALELARAGWSVLINYAADRNAAAECGALCRAATPASAGAVFETIQADISKPRDRARLLSFSQSTFGRVDLLVNNAGVAPKVRADLLQMKEASLDRLISVNLKGVFFLTQLFCNWWLGADVARAVESRPKIVFISSVSAYTASVDRAEYCMTKAAISMLTRLFAVRLAEHGINVYEIRPGVVATDMTAAVAASYDRLISEGLTPIRRWGQPADVGLAVRAVAEDRFPFSTGEVFNVDGGFHLQKL
jgi:3-oxoacyl-[acyl-carrier protein] reductase